MNLYVKDFLENIRDYAAAAHGDQQRQFTPEPYIAHPTRVMQTCQEYSTDPLLLSAALLHDVLEDTPITRHELQAFLLSQMNPSDAEMVTRLVVELTDIYIKEDFPKWNRRKRRQKEADRLGKTSAGAQTIKYADIIDNSITIVDVDTDFAAKYLFECRALLREMKDGNSNLRKRAIEVVDGCLRKLKR